ncbi:family 43 glycosylhydrolase [Dictyobacter halimunensis]
MNLHATGKAARGTGWIKWQNNPVLGGNLGTCFDLCLIRDADSYRMWFSWRPQKSIALVESKDGIHWSEPVIVLGPETSSGWEDDMNRPCVVKRGHTYHMWYTGQARGQSWIGHAVSTDGKNWTRTSNQPVLSPELPWEKIAVMCPHVIWDEAAGLYKMWYSGGEQYEPDAIGYATSPDGQTWTRHADTPIFYADPTERWEQYKVTACQVIPFEGWYLMFYVGFRDIDHAQIGLARSRDGITNWQRHPVNPIISSGENASSWDYDAAYKPFALHEQGRWLLWYNGRRDTFEQIGLAIHTGDDLQFDALTEESN